MDVQMLLDVIKGAVICDVDGTRKKYGSVDATVADLTGRYNVASISAEAGTVVVVLEKDKTIPNDMNVNWVKDHVARYGKEPNPFDGC